MVRNRHNGFVGGNDTTERERKAEEAARKIVKDIEEGLPATLLEGFRTCPLCGEEFDLVEVGVGPVRKPLTADATIRKVRDAMLALPPDSTTDPDIEKRIKEMEPVVHALKEIAKIMANCKSDMRAVKTDAERDRIAANALVEIDGALRRAVGA